MCLIYSMASVWLAYSIVKFTLNYYPNALSNPRPSIFATGLLSNLNLATPLETQLHKQRPCLQHVLLERYIDRNRGRGEKGENEDVREASVKGYG